MALKKTGYSPANNGPGSGTVSSYALPGYQFDIVSQGSEPLMVGPIVSKAV